MNISVLLRPFLCLALLLAVRGGAELQTFTIDPARSEVALSGTLFAAGLTAPMVEQGPGGLTARYAGTLRTDLYIGGINRIEFLPGSTIRATEVNEWQPGQGGVAGQALASYGGKATISLGFLSATALAAARNITLVATSPSLPLTGETFDAGALALQFADTANSVVDFRVSGVLNESGTKIVSGLLTNNVTTTGQLTTVDGVQTLTLPMDATFGFELESDLGLVTLTLTVKGQLVATAGGVVEEPVVNFDPPGTPGEPLTLHFSSSYKLQRATTLSPPNWMDFATESPVQIPLTEPGEFFRVVPK